MERDPDVVERLRRVGVVSGIRWAFVSATARTLDDFSEETGHDAGWLGSTRFTLFRDRLDRVFACGKYGLGPGADEAQGLDVLHAELTKVDIETMPVLPSDLVRRADLNQSPGWAYEELRFLLASSAFGKVDRLPWPQKSWTKRQVARQPNPEPQASLFDDLAPEEIGGLLEVSSDRELDLDTFVVAHSLATTGVAKAELVLGRPRMNNGGGDAWYWREDILSVPPTSGGWRASAPSPAGPDTVPDAMVRLRRPLATEATGLRELR